MNPNLGDEVMYAFFVWLMALIGPTQIISAIILIRRGRWVWRISRYGGLRRPALPAILGSPPEQLTVESGAKVRGRALFYFLYGLVFTGVGLYCLYRFAQTATSIQSWLVLLGGLIAVAALVRWFVTEPQKHT